MYVAAAHPVILFDGVCNLCHGSVNFVLKRDSKKVFRFASLQSRAAREILEPLGAQQHQETLDSVLLVENDHVFTKSEAALRIARKLDKPWPMLYPLIYVPRFIRFCFPNPKY
eukprot:TRINITY_DN8775_c0_g1_i3.p1 TRINITY_DN8775_c0_g1~~TRINITY_DN8775_c0_g1_i3.p1  ORF type:complete len:113 (+),score=3.02 TRINITY_DN8775_c0_g1_i3:184-522(+)